MPNSDLVLVGSVGIRLLVRNAPDGPLSACCLRGLHHGDQVVGVRPPFVHPLAAVTAIAVRFLQDASEILVHRFPKPPARPACADLPDVFLLVGSRRLHGRCRSFRMAISRERDLHARGLGQHIAAIRG